jgi:hypothetical protein
LPIGWDNVNLNQQSKEGIGWKFKELFFSPLQWLGWIVTGIAISMGASFWFDLLGKVINVRNTGSKPAVRADEEQSSTINN